MAISSDGVESHREFATRLAIPFSLATDADLAVARAFGVANEAARTREPAVFVVGSEAGCCTSIATTTREALPTTRA